jgi:hypothetical protein
MKTLRLLSILGLLSSSVFAQDAMTASADKTEKSDKEEKAELPILTAKSPIHIWVDQIGYRTSSKKVLVIASNNAIPAELELELRDAKSHQAVWKSKDDAKCVKPFNDGKKDGASGDFITHLDLSDFKTPGRYFVALLAPGTPGRSCAFNIGDNIYEAAGLASWKAFYYQRADGEKPEKYAGLWNHGVAFQGPNQAKEARIYKWTGARWFEPVGKEVADPTAYDVSGGWWDAGDFNKYTGNTVRCHNDLLLGYQIVASAAKDNQLNIPESGNKIPDLLDEVRYGTEYLIRIADKTGAAFGRCHLQGGCPPESVTNPAQLTVQNSGATMARAAALAYAAVVWKESKLDDAFAKKCQEEAQKSWDLLKEKPHPWPADPKDPKKLQYTGEWFALDYNQMRTLAAACLFNLTDNTEYHDIVKQGWDAEKGKQLQPGESGDIQPLVWVYSHTKGADSAIADAMKKMILDNSNKVIEMTGAGKGYLMSARGYWWGSNRLIGQMGAACVIAAELTADADAKKRYLDAAEEYVHYLFGRNALGKCFLSNMKSFGAENSIMVMFHSWVGADGNPKSAKYVGEGNGKIGPFPGMVVGGPNGSMKRYVEGLNWQASPWEFNEPDITYQSPCCQLLGYFALKVNGQK